MKRNLSDQSPSRSTYQLEITMLITNRTMTKSSLFISIRSLTSNCHEYFYVSHKSVKSRAGLDMRVERLFCQASGGTKLTNLSNNLSE